MKFQIERALKILFFLSEQITNCQQCLLISINDPSVCHRVYSGLFYNDAIYPYDRWSLSCRSSKYSLQIKRRWTTLKTDSNLEQYRARSGILLSQRHSPIRRFHKILLSRKLFDALPQCATIKFSTKSKASNKTYLGLISMLQGFQICIAWNPSK